MVKNGRKLPPELVRERLCRLGMCCSSERCFCFNAKYHINLLAKEWPTSFSYFHPTSFHHQCANSTHAQKYFQKLAKQDTPGSTTIKSTAKSHVTQQNSTGTASKSKVSEVSALTFLAHNYNNHNLAQHHDLPVTPPPPEESATTANASHGRESHNDGYRFHSENTLEKQPKKKLKLNIPEHHASSDPSTWPQPSPAACGHRKVEHSFIKHLWSLYYLI